MQIEHTNFVSLRTFVVISTLGALAGLAGGCAGGKSHDTPSAASVVEMHMHSFEPANVTIHVGEDVLWRNTSIIWHTVTADPSIAKKSEDVTLSSGSKPFDSGKVEAGGTYRQ